MKIGKCFFLMFLISFNFLGCKEEKKDFPENFIRCLNCNGEFIEEYPSYSSVKFIKLETSPECFIGHIREVYIQDSLIFIYHLLHPRELLFVFNKEGKFLAQIGNEGKGPGEYRRITTFYVDKENKQVVIIDDLKETLLKHDFTGKCISEEMIAYDYIKDSYQAFLMDNNQLFLYYKMTPQKSMAYSLVDIEKKELINNFFSYEQVDQYYTPFSRFAMTKTSEGVNFIMPFCDTVYNYSSSKISPKYIIETPGSASSKAAIVSQSTSYREIREKLMEQGFLTGFYCLFETDNKIFVGCLGKNMVGYFFADKEKKEGYYYNNYEMPYISELTKIPFSPIRIVTSYKNSLVCAVTPIELLRYDYQLGDDETSLLFNEMIKNLDENDNPVLFFYEFD